MGTRGLTGFVIDGEEKLSYQQYDSYPSGVGIDVLSWLRVAVDSVVALRDAVRKIQLLDEDAVLTQDQIDQLKKYADTRVSSGSLTEPYVLLRETQGRPDLMVEAGFMIDSKGFALDSLFCEWAYVIDLDEETFTVYRGFQKEVPTAGRWAGRPTAEEDAENYRLHIEYAKENNREPWRSEVSEYKAITPVASWPLTALPTDEEFLNVEKMVYGEDDDE